MNGLDQLKSVAAIVMICSAGILGCGGGGEEGPMLVSKQQETGKCSNKAQMRASAERFIRDLASAKVPAIKARLARRYDWVSINGPGRAKAMKYGAGGPSLGEEMRAWKSKAGDQDLRLTRLRFSERGPGDRRGFGFQGEARGSGDQVIGKAEIVCQTGKIYVWSMGIG